LDSLVEAVPISADGKLTPKRKSAPEVPKTVQKPAIRAPVPRQKETKQENDPPHAEESEKAVLGSLIQASLLKGSTVVPDTMRQLQPEHFFNQIHKEIYRNLLEMWKAEQPIDLLTFSQWLRDRNLMAKLGGDHYITGLSVDVLVPEYVYFHVDVLRRKYFDRQLVGLAALARAKGFGASAEEPGAVISAVSQSLERLRKAAGSPNGTQQFTLDNLMKYDPTRDPECLVGRRYIERGGSALWCGGAGTGKSALEMQLAIYWGTGTSVFGLRPVRPLKSLIVQAENDLGDTAEHFQGAIDGISALGDIEPKDRSEALRKNLAIYRVIGKSGFAFLGLLEELIQSEKPDLVWIDPLFAFAGCDLCKPDQTGAFLREGLFPLAEKYRCAIQVIHHVGKPQRDQNQNQAEIDVQYLGFGTSEIQNSFRCVNVLLPVADTPGLFRLTLSKRGERSGAKNPAGESARSIYIKHAEQGICWLQVDEPAPRDAKPMGRQAKYKDEDVTKHMSVIHPVKISELETKTRQRGMSRATFFRIFDRLEAEQKVSETAEGWLLKSQKSQKSQNDI
jgi:DnaB-like helicase N terminal domain/AAA domain